MEKLHLLSYFLLFFSFTNGQNSTISSTTLTALKIITNASLSTISPVVGSTPIGKTCNNCSSILTRKQISDLCIQSLETKMLGAGANNSASGNEFYQYFFTNFPDLRVYFKGAENYTAAEVEKSERFDKQGQRLLLGCHVLANVFDNEQVFNSYVRELMNKHRVYKIDPELWMAFFTVWTGYLAENGTLTDAQKGAWIELGKAFNSEAQDYLKILNLPYVH